MRLNYKMSSDMQKFLKKDSTLRIISIVIAIFLWIFVNDEINPIITVEMSIPLKSLNENTLKDKGLTIVNKSSFNTVSVVLKGRKQKVQGLVTDNLEANVSLDKIRNAGKNITLPVNLILNTSKENDGIVIDNYSPREIKLDVEKSGNNLFKLNVETQGELKDGYKLININTNPEYVLLEGGTSLNKVSAAKVFVDLSGVDYDLTLIKDFRLFDRNGKEIYYNNKKIPISINLEVAKVVKIIPLISGNPSEGFSELSRETNPKELYIRGAKEIVDEITEIKTEIVNIQGINENLNTKVKLQIPTNVKIVNNITDVDMDIKLKIK